jgi:sugar phosphate permease
MERPATLAPAATTPPSRFGPSHRWTVLAVGVAAQVSFSAAFSGIPVTGPTLRSGYHLTTTTLGLVLGCIALGIALSEIPWGLWTDRLGERAVLLTGLLGTGTCLAVMAVAIVPTGSFIPPIALLAGALLLVGLLGGSVNTSSGRAVMAWFPDGQRGFAMSIRQTAIPVGGAIGAALLPWLAADVGFRAVYAVLALFCFASAAATWRWLHEPDRQPDGSAHPAQATAVASPLRSRPVWRFALASLLLTVPQFAVLTFAAVYLSDAQHAGVATVSVTLLAVQLGGAAARVWSGRYTDKHRNRRAYIRAVGVATGLTLVATGLLLDAPAAVVASMLALGGLLASAWHGVAYTEIASIAGAQRAGTALGLENTTVFVAAFLTPVLIPIVLGSSSWTAVWMLAGVCSLLAVPLAPRAARR